METCDYIVVGAGSAGAAVANRLSADPRNKVLLLEAGRASHPWSSVPIGMARLITNPAANWLYSSEPEASTNGRRLPVPRGKWLGGSSSINGMVFVRGQAQDFDTWAQLGNRGWSYQDVLPFFKRMESYAGGGDDALRGRGGPLRVTNPEPHDPIFATMIKAAAEVGIPHNLDYNGASQEGIAMSQTTIAAGRWLSGKKGITFNDRGRGLGLVHQALRYAVSRKGMLAMAGAPMRAFVCSREGLEAPDLMLGLIPMLTEPGPKGPRISRQSGVTLYAHPMRPESKGHIHITATDPRRPPAINFNFLSAPPDAELTVRAVRIARAIMTAPAMAPFEVSEVAPGVDRTTDEEILDLVKQAAETTYHPVGTCKMGSDPLAVVDAQLGVHGIAGLRVADASIMPTLTSDNTNEPSMHSGDKAADMMLNTAT